MNINYRHKLINETDSTEKWLDVAPAGWADFTTRYYRHELYYGVLPVDSLSQKFINVGGEAFDHGGYFFVKDAYDTYGVKAKVRYERYKKNPFTDDFDLSRTAMIDFSPKNGFKIVPHLKYIDAKFIISSKLQSFMSNQAKDYSLDTLTASNGNSITPFVSHPVAVDYTPIHIYLDCDTSGTLRYIKSGLTVTGSDKDSYGRTASTNRLGNRYLETGVKIYENTTSGTAEQTIDVTIDVNLSYNISWDSTPIVAGSYNRITYIVYIQTVVYDSSGVVQSTANHFTDTKTHTSITGTQTDTFLGSVNVEEQYDMEPGWYIEFIASYNITNIDNMTAGFDIGATVYNYDFLEYYESENTAGIDSWLPYEVATRLVQLMTGESDINKLIYSTELGRTDSEFQTYTNNGDSAFIATIGGLALRQFPEGKTKCNFRDWFRSLSIMRNLAMYYDISNDRFAIVDIEDVYEDRQVYDFGVVSDLEITPSQEHYYSKVLSGTAEKGTYEEIQGVQEYNIQSEHSVDMPTDSNLDYRVPYNIDPLSIELARRAPYFSSGITDTKHDDKTLMVEVDSSLTTVVNDDVGTFTGFLGIEERYNGNYTPRSILTSAINHIGGLNFKDTTGTIQFVNNSKDVDIVKDGASESDDISYDPTDCYFFPEKISFKFTVDSELIDVLENDPHGYFKLTDVDGDTHYVYISTEGVEINEYKKTGTGVFIRANINR